MNPTRLGAVLASDRVAAPGEGDRQLHHRFGKTEPVLKPFVAEALPWLALRCTQRCNSGTSSGQVPSLSAKTLDHDQVHLLEQPGHGPSPVPAGGRRKS